MFVSRPWACLLVGFMLTLQALANVFAGASEAIFVYDVYLLEQKLNGNGAHVRYMLPHTVTTGNTPASFKQYARDVYGIDIDESKFHYEGYAPGTSRAEVAADLKREYGGEWKWNPGALLRNVKQDASYLSIMRKVSEKYQKTILKANHDTDLAAKAKEGFRNVYHVRLQTSEMAFLKGNYIDDLRGIFDDPVHRTKEVQGVHEQYEKVNIGSYIDNWLPYNRHQEDIDQMEADLEGVRDRFKASYTERSHWPITDELRAFGSLHYDMDEACLPKPQRDSPGPEWTPR